MKQCKGSKSLPQHVRRPNLALALPPATPDLKNMCVSDLQHATKKKKKKGEAEVHRG